MLKERKRYHSYTEQDLDYDADEDIDIGSEDSNTVWRSEEQSIDRQFIVPDDDIDLDDDDLNEINSFVDAIAESVSSTSTKSGQRYKANKKRRRIVRKRETLRLNYKNSD
jgi:hypothetical protein